MKSNKQTRSYDNCETPKINKQVYVNNMILKQKKIIMKINKQAIIINNSLSNNSDFANKQI